MRDERVNRVVLAIADSHSAKTLHRAVDADCAEVVGIAANSVDAIKLICETTPDAVISDMVLPGADGCEMVRLITKLPLNTMPVVLLLSMKEFDRLNRAALSIGAHRVFIKPVDLREVLDALRTCDIAARCPREGMSIERVSETLSSLGFPARLKGTGYLTTAVMLVLMDGRLSHELTIKLYPLVGEAHQTDAKTVERTMRRAIESAWSAGALDKQHALFGNTIDARRGKPTCGELIARIADLLREKE